MNRQLSYFKLIDLDQQSKQNFDSRDELLSYLEFEQQKAILSEEAIHYQIEWYQNGSLSDLVYLDIPYEGTIDDLLINFATKKGITINPDLEADIRINADSKLNKQSKEWKNLLIIGLQLLMVVLFGLTVMTSLGLKSRTSHLEKEVSHLEKQEQVNTKLTILGKYALAYAYAEDWKQLAKFYDDGDIIESTLSEGQLTSVQLYQVERNKAISKVSYFATVQTEKGAEIKKLTFEVSKVKNNPFGYKIRSQIFEENISE